MAAKALGAVLIALLAGGCALLQPKPLEVKVPVPVRAAPPPELLSCTADLPIPRFEACGAAGWACLSPQQEAVLRSLVHRLMTCDEGWRAWAGPP